MSALESLTDSHERAINESDEENVPVNRKTTFNGRLNQYFHTSKHAPTSTTITTAPGPLKRSLEVSNTTTSTDNNSPTQSDTISESRSSSKRRKNPKLSAIPARITRSRSASSTPSSTTTSTTPEDSQPQPQPKSTPRSSRRSQPTSTPATPTPTTTSTTTTTPNSLLRDTIPPNLTLLLVGVNPGILTGTTGYAYAHPSNLFWKLLHSSGITPIRHPPSDTYRLPALYNIGNTNIVERPTRDASMLSKAEMNAGVPVLEAKVAAQRPEAVCLVGKSIWEAVWRVRKGRAIRKEEFRYGWQDEEENMGRTEEWDGARVFVATTTSGLAATMSREEKQAVWDELGRWVVGRREEEARRVAAHDTT